jgi:hypothetical protein
MATNSPKRQVPVAADATREIAAVFSASFEPEYFTPDSCAEVGPRLFAQLHGGQVSSMSKAQSSLLSCRNDFRPNRNAIPSTYVN